MARMDEKKRMFLIGGTALFLSLAACGGTWWAMGLIEKEKNGIAADQTLIEKAEAKIAKIPDTEKEVIILRENLDSYVKILPDDRDLNEFVKMLNKFQEQSGITLVEFKPSKQVARSKKAAQFSKTEYTYEVTATLWQFLRFVSFIENYERFVSITSFSIGAAGKRNEQVQTDGDPIHSIKLTMETYTYNGKATGHDVQIPNYEAKRDGLREDILRRQQAIPIERYKYAGDTGQRRDIFEDPRQRVNPDGTSDGPSLQEQLALIDRYSQQVGKLREILQRSRRPDQNIFQVFAAEKEVRDSIVKLEVEIDHINEQKTISSGLRAQWAKNVVDALAALKEDLAKKDGTDEPKDPHLQLADLKQLLEDMTSDLVAGRLEDARTRYETVQDKMGVPVGDPRHELEVKVRAAYVKATTALAFAALHLDIQGVLVNHEGRSGVLLNGEVLEEGDYVNDELLVRKVREEQVEFVFRGLTVIRTL
ncbi:MAG: hypothetical protein Fur0037_21990 [Planctomycetota bacterium]